jgi:hypothetical protein
VAEAARAPGPARHEIPLIDERALAAARACERLLAEAAERVSGSDASARGAARWARELGGVPDVLRDGDLRDVRRGALRARSAYGPKDSVRDALPPDVTEPFLAEIDRLIREIARYDRAR